MSETTTTTAANATDAFYQRVKDNNLSPLWQLLGSLKEYPETNMVPYLWKYSEVREIMVEAGEVVPLEDALRRVLGFRNPGSLPHQRTSATDSLWAAAQLVMPGEVAPAHRHTPSALRFIIEGDGAYTVVNGQRVPMEVGDFLLTPNMHWHEHGHEGDGPMIWLDGLDSPLITKLNLYSMFDSEDLQEVDPSMPAKVVSGEIVPVNSPDYAVKQPLVFKLADAKAVLESIRDLEPDPYDDIIVEYKNPRTNGPVMTTISAYLQIIRPGIDTKAHRHTHGSVYHVVEGSGYSIIDGQKFEWEKGDTFAIPLWYEHSHHNNTDEDALLFSYTDKPMVEKLDLYREEAGQ